MLERQRRLKTIIFGFLFSMLAAPVVADDTEIYLTNQDNLGLPNILFILDTSGSMKEDPAGNQLEGEEDHPNSRFQIMKRALNNSLASIPGNINVGLMNYAGHNDTLAKANGIQYPVQPISEQKAEGIQVRDELLAEADTFRAQDFTPIVQSLYEAALYYKNLDADYGAVNEADNPRRAHEESYTDNNMVTLTTQNRVDICDDSAGECAGKNILEDSCEDDRFWCNPDTNGCDQYIAMGLQLESCIVVPATEGGCTDRQVKDQCIRTNEAGECVEWSFKTEEVCWGPDPEKPSCSYLYRQCRFQEQVEVSIPSWTYNTPIVKECQESYIVLLSDGEPDDGLEPGTDPVIANKIGDKFGLTCENGNAEDGTPLPADGFCGPELTHYLATVDQNPTLEEEQFIHTYVIGFAVEGPGQEYLKTLAQPNPKLPDPAENNGFFPAEDESDLQLALTSILQNFSTVNSTLNPPAISVNQTTQLETASAALLPMFRPGNLPRWTGNLKRYALDTTGNPPVLKDSSTPAINVGAEGTIPADARSFWLPDVDAEGDPMQPDGPNVEQGGAAYLLGNTPRRLFTNDLTSNLVPIDNNIDNATFGATDNGHKAELIAYLSGFDDDGMLRRAMGDILHSRPTIINYDTNQVAENEAENYENSYVFVGTNEGYLHAFNIDDGTEAFAFMPRELLGNSAILHKNDFNDTHPFGLDGPITTWRVDRNENGKIDEDENEWRIAVGMRRGGSNYYTLDVTDPENPSLQWIIHGGLEKAPAGDTLPAYPEACGETGWVERGTAATPAAPETPATPGAPATPAAPAAAVTAQADLPNLGLTWSKPIMTWIERDGKPLQVLVFGGGYDPKQDIYQSRPECADGVDDDDNPIANAGLRTPDTIGNSVYIVDAETGGQVYSWSASLTGADLELDSMANSIPANIRVIDLNGNDIADRLYVSDTGGRIFRIDLPDSGNSLVGSEDREVFKGTLIADLALDGEIATNRRFYYEPDAALIRDGSQRYISLAIGSGFRAHPLLKGDVGAQNRLYMIKDPYIYSAPPEDFTAITEETLLDASITADVSQLPAEEIEGRGNGWYINLDRAAGEKALARAVTFNGNIFFTTFEPVTEAPEDLCSIPTHTGHVYVIEAATARSAIKAVNILEEPTLDDRRVSLSTADILPEVYLTFRADDATNKVIVDSYTGGKFDKPIKQDKLDSLRKIFWEEER